jgi:hypothetical protein
LIDTIKEEKKKRGKTSRAAGKKFELDVRKDLESRKFIVCKWTNIVDLDNNQLIQAKNKYNPFLKRIISEGAGFPDFIVYKLGSTPFGVEAKKGKYLDAKEKKMAAWLLDNKIFSRIYIAHPIKEGRHTQIVYQNFVR